MTFPVQKWGNSLGLRIPKSIARQNQIAEGTELQVVSKNGRVILRAPKTPSLKQLLAGMRPGNCPQLGDWGRNSGEPCRARPARPEATSSGWISTPKWAMSRQ